MTIKEWLAKLPGERNMNSLIHQFCRLTPEQAQQTIAHLYAGDGNKALAYLDECNEVNK